MLDLDEIGTGLRVFNTLTRQIEPFRPIIAGQVKMFVCGPTVYDYAHLGNAKTYTQFDFIARYLRKKGYDVFYLQNITDIDDKIIKAASTRGVNWKSLAEEYEQVYLVDMAALGNTAVTEFARATDYIDRIVSQVESLLRRGFAYRTSTGIYFEIEKFADYGKLSRRREAQSADSISRIDEDKEKRGPSDFCLWKGPKDGEPRWETAIGPGRPGWHIEDTAITEQFFGPQYDLHGGAIDLVFPHHEAEIAQMEAASGRVPLVRYWLHTGFLTTGVEKMSKSTGKLRTIRSALEQFDYRTLRFLFLSNHYRSNIAYSDAVLVQAANAVERLNEFAFRVDPDLDDVGNLPAIANLERAIAAALDNDFDTPAAFARLFEFVRDQNRSGRPSGMRTLAMLREFNELFDVVETHPSADDAVIDALLLSRAEHRRLRQFDQADAVRREIEAQGIQIYDKKDGVTWRRITGRSA